MRLTSTLMNLCLCLAWTQTVQIESACVYPLIRVHMGVGFIWVIRRCHGCNSGIVRDFWVDLVLVVQHVHKTEEAGGFIDAIIDSVISSLDIELSLFLYLHFSIVDDRSAVAGTEIYMPFIISPARLQEDGTDMEHFLSRNIVVILPKSNRLIDRRESGKVEVCRTLTW